MDLPAHPADELARSTALLAEYGLPEHAPVEQLRSLARIAAAMCQVPTAVVNLLDGCYQHQVGEVGFTGERSPLSSSMCAAANSEPRLRHVPDATLEPAFVDNPWVDGRLADVRFYASAPLVLGDGRVLGSLCVFADQPASLSSAQQRALQDLAGQAVHLIEQARHAREAERQAALFRLVAEGSADVLSRHRNDGTVIYVSPSVQQVLGLDASRVIGRSPSTRIHPDDRTAVRAAAQAILDGQQESATARLRARRADRSWRWLEVQLAPIRDEIGQVLELHSVARDITRRVQAEERLATVAAQARSIVDTCADAFISIDGDGVVLDWNPSAEATFGWRRDEVIGRDMSQLIVPGDARGAHDAGLTRLQAGGTPSILGQRVQVTAQHRDGGLLPVELTVWRSQATTGWRYNAFLRDVTERQQAQAALAAARDDAERRAALTSAVLDTIDVGVVACDATGRLTLFNRAARDLHGRAEDPELDAEDWAGQYGLYDEDGVTLLARDRVPLVRALTDGALRDATMVIAPSGAAARTVRCDGRAMHDGEGRLLGAVVAMKDITDARARASELVQARDQALAATRAKTAFLAAASHEIRTPLNGVLGSLELLSLQALTEEQARYVAVAHESGRCLLQLLNDVLDLSKAEVTTVALQDEAVHPVGVARDVIAALEPVASRKGLHLHLHPVRDQRVRGDAARLRQVLMNLVGNAIKFTVDGGVTVTVDSRSTSRGGARLHLSVTDTGPGMPPEELARLFTPFVQGAQGQRYGGTGLGLALTQQVVDVMGGRIEVASEVGRGSTFTVVVDLDVASEDLPADDGVDADLPTVPAPPHTVEDIGRGALRVLVADDNDTNLMVAEAMLTLLGAEVVTVGDGDDAVDAVARQPFDLVLLDHCMPRMSGTDAARAIRSLPGTAGRTRLLALTASVTEEDRREFHSSGMDEVLLKPVQLSDLQQALEAVTGST